ncbi:hypothetical protein Tsubulata_014567 [Turnera subulata]|uniref:Remorin C-terminal domain-containing protein n=1 Tax=Turnera subulata TaxID=218843 RepID=A0A9Q0FGW0_9ROSI|nr:hypothetical protein Tsubulata_014567 [Turnera subulata]
MESLLMQKRVKFSGQEHEEASSAGEKMNNKAKTWFPSQAYWQMSQDYVPQESEYAAAVAAAAFAVNSIEEAELDRRRKMKEDFERAKSRMNTMNESATSGSVRVTRSFTGKEVKDAGETSTARQKQQDQRAQESSMTSRKPSRSTSMRLKNPADQKQRGNSSRGDVMDDKVGSWEKAQLLKIHKRYEKLKSRIFSWENSKKTQAKLHMEKKKSELELRKTRNSQHYQDKLARIDMIAGGARAQLEEKRRNEESVVEEKAKYMRRKGRSPVKFFCC